MCVDCAKSDAGIEYRCNVDRACVRFANTIRSPTILGRPSVLPPYFYTIRLIISLLAPRRLPKIYSEISRIRPLIFTCVKSATVCLNFRLQSHLTLAQKKSPCLKVGIFFSILGLLVDFMAITRLQPVG